MTYEEAYDYVVDFVNKGETLAMVVDRDGQILNFSLTPAQFTQKYVEYKILKDNVGYVSIYQFGTNSVSELNEALTELEKAGVKGYVRCPQRPGRRT